MVSWSFDYLPSQVLRFSYSTSQSLSVIRSPCHKDQEAFPYSATAFSSWKFPRGTEKTTTITAICCFRRSHLRSDSSSATAPSWAISTSFCGMVKRPRFSFERKSFRARLTDLTKACSKFLIDLLVYGLNKLADQKTLTTTNFVSLKSRIRMVEPQETNLNQLK